MRDKIRKGIEEVLERDADTVVGVVGGVIVAEGKRALKSGFVAFEYCEGGSDARARGDGFDFLSEGRMPDAQLR